MVIIKTKTSKCLFSKSILFLALLYSPHVFPQNVKLLNWTELTVGNISTSSKNYNRIKGNAWGITNRSDIFSPNRVLPYSITDIAMSGPDGEKYGIELEFGSLAIKPRSFNSRSVKHYVDCGQTGFQERGNDRSEMHMRRLFEEMDITEGSSIWLGWSEYYKHLDKTRVSTVLQFRNQPSPVALLKQILIPVNSSVLKSVVDGGPVIAIELWPDKNDIRYHFAVRRGKPDKWRIPSSNRFTDSNALKKGVWYDFVVNLKYSRTSDGYFRIWHGLASNSKTALTLSNYTWAYYGPTMYQYPTIYGVTVKPEPSLRWGLYRFGCKTASLNAGNPPIDGNNRYMTKFLGPVRLWKGESDIGFGFVKPRN